MSKKAKAQFEYEIEITALEVGMITLYDMRADGLSLDDKRNELLPVEKLGAVPASRVC